jgi:hypothetical protein
MFQKDLSFLDFFLIVPYVWGFGVVCSLVYFGVKCFFGAFILLLFVFLQIYL